jgi:hypothetical protein
MKASHKNISQIVGHKQVRLQSGQFIFGRRKAAEEINMSERSIRTCLSFLERHGNLTIETTHHYSIITICNWPSYQTDIYKSDPQNDPGATTNKNIIILLYNMRIGKNDQSRYSIINFWKKSYTDDIVEESITIAYEKFLAGKVITEGYIVGIMKNLRRKNKIPTYSGAKEPWEDG